MSLILRWFQAGEALHANFYEDRTSARDIADSLDDAEGLLDQICPMLHPAQSFTERT